jgi:exodeoxyribonuclease VII large subunit
MSRRDYSVTEITRYIKMRLESDGFLKRVGVNGEISNFKKHSSGHLYFSLKDDNSVIRCVMFKSDAIKNKFEPEEGMSVLIIGSVSVYEKTGAYQIYVRQMEPKGIGTLYRAYEQLKAKLEALGWFAEENKKTIPYFPEHIGIITSQTGSAIKDITSIISRRFPGVKMSLYPVLVQGENAKYGIAEALKYLDEKPEVDVIILGRGGGSIEDLWAFNEEMVAQAVFSSDTPVISAVGHETDFTICDFVADLRAATPSAAAELVVPDRRELLISLSQYEKQINIIINSKKEKETEKIIQLKSRLYQKSPQIIVNRKGEDLDYFRMEMQKVMVRKTEKKGNELIHIRERLQALGHQNVLHRGYVIARKQSGQVVRKSEEVQKDEIINLLFCDGTKKVRVIE